MDPPQTILVRVSGPDRPGVLAGVLGVMATSAADIQDIEQVVIRRRLTLGIVVAVPAGQDLLKDLLFYAWEQDLAVEFDVVDPTPTPHLGAHAVTVMGETIGPAEMASVARAIADAGANVKRIVRLARYPVFSYELVVDGGEPDQMRQNLLLAAARHPGVDIAVQREGLGRRAKRVVVMDVDSTLVQDEVIDLLAEEAGRVVEVRSVTEQAMAGDLDFETALRERVRCLAGLDEAALDRVWERVTITPGARTFVATLRRLGFTTAIVSGGFTRFSEQLRARLGIDHAFANTLEAVDGKLTGELVGPIIDRAGKAAVLERVAASEGVPLEQVVAIGDGANDIDMLTAAGLGIAFNAKPVVREAADTAVTVPYLDAILFMLGVSREEVEAAGI